MEGLVVHFIGYFSASKQEFHVRRKSVRGSWCPPWPSAVKQRIAAFVVLRKCHNKAAIHFDNDLQTWTYPRRPRTSSAYAVAAAQQIFIVGISPSLQIVEIGRAHV